MSDTSGRAVFGPETAFRGRIRRGRHIEIHGRVEGEIASAHVLIGPGGHFRGILRTGTVEVQGQIEGEIFAKSLLRIGANGAVHGKIQYGAIEMAPGADLVADLRNVPPTLAGDLSISVHRGRTAVITREDLEAIDPDDAPEDLTFTVGRLSGGHVAERGAPSHAIATFTQADLDAGRIVFQHDGSGGDQASIEVTLADSDGASAGTAQTIRVTVVDIPDRRAGL